MSRKNIEKQLGNGLEATPEKNQENPQPQPELNLKDKKIRFNEIANQIRESRKNGDPVDKNLESEGRILHKEITAEQETNKQLQEIETGELENPKKIKELEESIPDLEDEGRSEQNEDMNRLDGFMLLNLEARGYNRVDPPFSYEVESSSTPGKQYNCEVLGWKMEGEEIIVIGWEHKGSSIVRGKDGWGRPEAQRKDDWVQIRRPIDEFPTNPRFEEIKRLAKETKP